MHFEKRRYGLLREAFGSEGECVSVRGKKESIGPGKRGEHITQLSALHSFLFSGTPAVFTSFSKTDTFFFLPYAYSR